MCYHTEPCSYCIFKIQIYVVRSVSSTFFIFKQSSDPAQSRIRAKCAGSSLQLLEKILGNSQTQLVREHLFSYTNHGSLPVVDIKKSLNTVCA